MNDLSKYFRDDPVRVRRASNEDVDDLVTIINDAYSYQDEARGEPRTNHEHLTKRIAETEFYTVVDGGIIIGCVYLEPHASAMHFGLLTLVPTYRGKGLAQEVVAAIENYAKSNRFTSLELDYMSVAPWLKQYYEKYGFTQTNTVSHWGSIDLLRMVKVLE